MVALHGGFKSRRLKVKETKQQLLEKVKAQKHLKMNGTMRNAN